MMGRTSTESPFTVPTPQEVQRFERRHLGGPTISNFRVDVGEKSSLASKWNKLAAELFAERFIQTGRFVCKDEELVKV
jgi:hypothetical protein